MWGSKARKPHIFDVCENLMFHKVFARIEDVRLAGLETTTERLGLKSVYGGLNIQPSGPTLSQVRGECVFDDMQ